MTKRHPGRGLLESGFVALATPADMLVLLMPLAITASVLTRYFLNDPLPAVYELTEYSMLWITFLAVPLVTWDREHITVEIVDGFLSPDMKRRVIPPLETVGAILSAVIVLAFLAMSLRTVRGAHDSGTLMVTTYRPPRWIIFSVVPISAGLTVTALVAQRMRRWAPEAIATGERQL